MSQINTAMAAAMAAAVKSNLDGGCLYIFAGKMPDSAADALDMTATHTQIAKITVGGDGSTGLTFGAPTIGVASKNTSETWSGPVAFDGANAGASTLAPTFWRFCAAGDSGRAGNVASARWQGSAGGPSSADELVLSADTYGPTGNTITVSKFYLRINNAG